jgi:hypothetical protein
MSNRVRHPGSITYSLGLLGPHALAIRLCLILGIAQGLAALGFGFAQTAVR